jgi:hypothetical protein
MDQKENKHTVTVFTPFDFTQGQKIRIDSGPREGDWEVVSVSERKVRLKCPVSLKEFEWNRFCYRIEERIVDRWPQRD